MITHPSCSVDGCDGRHYARGRCMNHHRRWLRHGDPLGGRTPNGHSARFLREEVFSYKGDECLVWPFGRGAGGYGKICLNGRSHLVHRLVCEHVHGAPPSPRHEAAHSCGNGSNGCVNPKHLRWATRTENMADRLMHGAHNRGERNGQARLTEEDVHKIRTLNGRAADIARMFGISAATVHSIRDKTTWGWLK